MYITIASFVACSGGATPPVLNRRKQILNENGSNIWQADV